MKGTKLMLTQWTDRCISQEQPSKHDHPMYGEMIKFEYWWGRV